MKDEIIVPAIFENLTVIAEFLQEKIKQEHLVSRKTWELLLVTDEICSHVIQFRKYDKTIDKLKIMWEAFPDRVEVIIETKGIPFNPLELNSPEDKKEEEEESLGGMNIHLVRKMVDEIKYTRTNNSNILRLKKYRRSVRNKYDK